jgi:hypothetical protein
MAIRIDSATSSASYEPGSGWLGGITIATSSSCRSGPTAPFKVAPASMTADGAKFPPTAVVKLPGAKGEFALSSHRGSVSRDSRAISVQP